VKRPLLLAGLASAVLASPVFGQSMDHSMHNMPGMTMPAKPAAKAAPKPARKAAAKPAPKRKAPVRSTPPRRGQAALAPAADPHAGHDMSGTQGMNMGGQQAAPAQDPHSGHDMSAMPGMGSPAAAGQDPHAGHDMSAMPGIASDGSQAGAKVGTDLPPGNKPAPAPPGDHLADRFWGADAMANSRENDLRRKHGGMTNYQVLFNLAEYQARKGSDGYL
jgi:copper resistance protein B